jgi:hypothetical protein
MVRFFLSLACASAAVSSALAAPLATDTPTTTAWGVGFTAPKAWILTTAPGEAVLTAPEGDLPAPGARGVGRRDGVRI